MTPELRTIVPATLAIIAIIAAVAAASAYVLTRQETLTATIVGTDRECRTDSDGMDCRYVVFTDAEVFENRDSLLDGKWNSSDVQRVLRDAEGETVELRVRGMRIPFLSAYRNIVEVTR